MTPTAGAGAGTAVTRNYLFAFNATTGALDTGFVPSVNGEVDSIVPTADGTGVYVGGEFTTAGGVATRLAEFNLTTGARVTTFNPSLNGPINDMALRRQPAAHRRHVHRRSRASCTTGWHRSTPTTGAHRPLPDRST